MESSALRNRLSGLSVGRSNVTDLVGNSDNLFMSFVRSSIGPISSSSDSSESHNVSLFVESSSAVGSGITSGFRNLSNCFMQKRVECSPPHFSHCSGGPMSSLIRSAYVRVGCSLLCSTCCFKASASVFIDELGRGIFAVLFRAAASIFREWSVGEVGFFCSASYLARFFKAWASFFSDLVGRGPVSLLGRFAVEVWLVWGLV